MALTRDKLEARLRTIYGSTPRCPHCEDKITQAMAAIDEYTATATEPSYGELWTAEEVAAHVGLKDGNAGRSWLHRAGIQRAVTRPDPDSGRLRSLFDADRVRAVHLMKESV